MVKSGCARNVPKKRLYSIKELAKEIGGTVWFWRTQIWDGQLPYIQAGKNKMLIDSVDVESIYSKEQGQQLTK